MSSGRTSPEDAAAALLARWQKDGDRQALDELLRLEVALLRDRLKHRGAHRAELSASDVAQEAVLGLLSVRESPVFEEPGALRAYLWKSALRLLARHSERGSAEPFDPTASRGLASALSSTGGLSAVESDDRALALELVLSLLEPDERSILDAVYFQGRTTEEAALELGITSEAAKKRLQRARRTLATKLGDWSELVG